MSQGTTSLLVSGALLSTIASGFVFASKIRGAGAVALILGAVTTLSIAGIAEVHVQNVSKAAVETVVKNGSKPKDVDMLRRAAITKEKNGKPYRIVIVSAFFVVIWTMWLIIPNMWPVEWYMEGLWGILASIIATVLSVTCVVSKSVRHQFAETSKMSLGIFTCCFCIFCAPIDVSSANSPTELGAHWVIFVVVFYAAALHGLAFTSPGLKFEHVFCQSFFVLFSPVAMAAIGATGIVGYLVRVRYPQYLERTEKKTLEQAKNAKKVKFNTRLVDDSPVQIDPEPQMSSSSISTRIASSSTEPPADSPKGAPAIAPKGTSPKAPRGTPAKARKGTKETPVEDIPVVPVLEPIEDPELGLPKEQEDKDAAPMLSPIDDEPVKIST